jgi:hypothetical protein
MAELFLDAVDAAPEWLWTVVGTNPIAQPRLEVVIDLVHFGVVVVAAGDAALHCSIPDASAWLNESWHGDHWGPSVPCNAADYAHLIGSRQERFRFRHHVRVPANLGLGFDSN